MSFKIDNQYLDASLTGAARGITGLPLEHPFDCVKTNWQAAPHLPSASKVAQQIYADKGIRGFYAGALPNGTRMVIKQSYRFPMMVSFPEFYSTRLPEGVKKNLPHAEDALTGVTIASLESGVITPLERLKVMIMTSDKANRSVLKFFSENKSHVFQELFRGFKACFLRQVVTWSTFSVADAFFKKKARELTNKKEKEALDFPSLMGVSLLVGAVNTAAVMPFDFVKTQLQKQNPLQQGVTSTMRHFIKERGLSALYTGWRVKMVHYMLHSAYTVTLLDKLKVKWKSDKNEGS